VVAIDQQQRRISDRNSNSVCWPPKCASRAANRFLLGNAADHVTICAKKFYARLREDALVLSVEFRWGMYDLVETVLKDLGAEFYFDAVALPLASQPFFGKCQKQFRLRPCRQSRLHHGNVRVVRGPRDRLAQRRNRRDLPLVEARLAAALNEKPGLTHFLPARVEWVHTILK